MIAELCVNFNIRAFVSTTSVILLPSHSSPNRIFSKSRPPPRLYHHTTANPHCLPNAHFIRSHYSIPHSKARQHSYHPIHIIRDASQESCRCGPSEEGRCPRKPSFIQRFVRPRATHHNVVALCRRRMDDGRERVLMLSARYDQGSHPPSRLNP